MKRRCKWRSKWIWREQEREQKQQQPESSPPGSLRVSHRFHRRPNRIIICCPGRVRVHARALIIMSLLLKGDSQTHKTLFVGGRRWKKIKSEKRKKEKKKKRSSRDRDELELMIKFNFFLFLPPSLPPLPLDQCQSSQAADRSRVSTLPFTFRRRRRH